MHTIWPGRRAHWVKYDNISNSDLDCMSLASFCQSRHVYDVIRCYLYDVMHRASLFEVHNTATRQILLKAF